MIPFPAPAPADAAGSPAPALAEARAASPTAAPVVVRSRAMGGRLEVHVRTSPGLRDGGTAEIAAAEVDAARASGRVRAWARILTRHDPSSELMLLNGDARASVPVRPTLAAALAWAAEAVALTGGVVDPTLLDERLAAESGAPLPAVGRPAPAWKVLGSSGAGRRAIVDRVPGLHFDLDGVAKGWIADRALRMLDRYPAALVDADGDIAARITGEEEWQVAIGDPRDDRLALAIVRLDRLAAGRDGRVGLATSGTSIHRWPSAPSMPPDRAAAGDATTSARHHLIDPRTGQPAATGVIQATVLAGSAASAEAWAKTAVILGATAGLDALDRAGVRGAVLLLDDGRTVALPRTTRYLA